MPARDLFKKQFLEEGAMNDDLSVEFVSSFTPKGGIVASESPFLPRGEISVYVDQAQEDYYAAAESIRVDQWLLTRVLSRYTAQLADPASPESRFFLALADARTPEELRTFSEAYLGIFRFLFDVSDFTTYASKAGVVASISSISSFISNLRAAKLAGMREKLFNGNFQDYGNLYSFIAQEAIRTDSPSVLVSPELGSGVLSQFNSLMVKPRVSYSGVDSYAGYREAAEDYWSIARSYFTGTFLSSLTTRTATISAGETSVDSISPNTISMGTFQKLHRVDVDGETGRFGYDASVRMVRSSTSVFASVPHIASGDITFKSGLPAAYQSDLSKRVIDRLFNENSGSRPYSYAALMADPANKSSYTSEPSVNKELAEIGLGIYERLTKDELLDQAWLMASDLVDYCDSNDPEIDYEDPSDLPDIRDFVVEELEEMSTNLRSSYTVASLKRLKFYKYIMAPFVGVNSSTSGAVWNAFSAETSVSSEFSGLRDAVAGLRASLLSSGKFDEIE